MTDRFDNQLSLSLHSNVASIRHGLGLVCTHLSECAFERDIVDHFELALAEVLNNVAEHAYPFDDHGKISVHVSSANMLISCTIRDHGRPMPGGKVPLGKQVHLGDSIDDVPEGSFGWFLIHGLARDIRYRRIDNENDLTFSMTTTHLSEVSHEIGHHP